MERLLKDQKKLRNLEARTAEVEAELVSILRRASDVWLAKHSMIEYLGASGGCTRRSARTNTRVDSADA